MCIDPCSIAMHIFPYPMPTSMTTLCCFLACILHGVSIITFVSSPAHVPSCQQPCGWLGTPETGRKSNLIITLRCGVTPNTPGHPLPAGAHQAADGGQQPGGQHQTCEEQCTCGGGSGGGVCTAGSCSWRRLCLLCAQPAVKQRLGVSALYALRWVRVMCLCGLLTECRRQV